MNVDINRVVRLFFSRVRIRDGEIMHPHRDWKRLLLATFVAALLFAGWGGYLFWQIRVGELVSGDVTSAERPASINRALLNEILTQYEVRRAEFEALERGETIPENPAQ